LPFLLKVLAASKPLSLQAHPSLEQARRGFAREQALGLALSAPNRNYKDPNHKPELICALTPFRALCGFRPFAETKAWLNALNLAALRALSASTLPKTVEHIMTLPPEGARHLVDAIAFACRTSPVRGFEKESAVIANLALAYPGDVGVLGAMLLNFVELQPTEALALGAGNLHAYLDGTGIELMANSDNVLRGGLTNKHIDVPELMSVLDFTEGPATKLRPSEETEAVYQTDFPDFRLSRIDVTAPLRLARLGPDILLCTEGAVDVNGFALRRGASAFARYDEGPLELSGRGTLFRATVHE
jgi:mannose-6-phosphate isomerase